MDMTRWLDLDDIRVEEILEIERAVTTHAAKAKLLIELEELLKQGELTKERLRSMYVEEVNSLADMATRRVKRYSFQQTEEINSDELVKEAIEGMSDGEEQ